MSTQSEHYSASDCDECGKGKYRAQTHDTACSICQRSRYTNENGRGDCKWCSAGKYIADHASTQIHIIVLMTAVNAERKIPCTTHTTLLAVYVSAVDTQMKMAAVIVSGVVRNIHLRP